MSITTSTEKPITTPIATRPHTDDAAGFDTPEAALAARLASGGDIAAAARDGLPDALSPEAREIVLADMTRCLDEARAARGYAEIYDLHRAGYRPAHAVRLGPEAARLMAGLVAGRLEAERLEAERLDAGAAA